jgi:Arc/MetJ-type ribon-helix-helix transcriptional regulator
MTIIVPPEVEDSINAAVQSGYFASIDEAMTKAARLLLEQLPTAKINGMSLS